MDVLISPLDHVVDTRNEQRFPHSGQAFGCHETSIEYRSDQCPRAEVVECVWTNTVSGPRE